MKLIHKFLAVLFVATLALASVSSTVAHADGGGSCPGDGQGGSSGKCGTN